MVLSRQRWGPWDCRLPRSPRFSGARGVRTSLGPGPVNRLKGLGSVHPLPLNYQQTSPLRGGTHGGLSQPSPAGLSRGKARLDRGAGCGGQTGGSNLVRQRPRTDGQGTSFRRDGSKSKDGELRSGKRKKEPAVLGSLAGFRPKEGNTSWNTELPRDRSGIHVKEWDVPSWQIHPR